MANLVTDAPVSRAVADSDHNLGPDYNFGPDFAWAAVGGIALVALAAIVYSLAVTWGGFNLGASPPGAPVAPLSAYYRELAGLFLTGFLIVLIARSLSTQSGSRPGA